MPARGSGNAQWKIRGPPSLFLPLAHLSYVIGLIWIYGRLRQDGPRTPQGLRLGLLGFAIGQAPLWLLWYAEQPWPGTLLVKQLPLELCSLIIGVTITLLAGPASHTVAAPSSATA